MGTFDRNGIYKNFSFSPGKYGLKVLIIEDGHSVFNYLLKKFKFPGKYLGQFTYPISCGTFKHKNRSIQI